MQGKIKAYWKVSIHSWSSYQEKLDKDFYGLYLAVFQSTPGLVTRRNLVKCKDCKFFVQVSIHSWSSYQEKLDPEMRA